MPSDPNRAFNYAVLASIALHGLLLFAFSAHHNQASRAAPPAPLVARLVQPAPAVPAPPQREPVKPESQQAPPPKPAPVPKPAPAPKRVAKPAPQPRAKPAVPAPQPSAPVGEAVPAAPPAPAAAEVPAAPAAPAAPPVIARTDPAAAAASPSVESVDAGSLAQYRLQVISAARKYKRYPRVAMDNNWEGAVVVSMVIGANGMISALSIKTSSGHEILDKQALDMFRKAKPLVLIPAALRGREFTIELRAIYNLKDQESG